MNKPSLTPAEALKLCLQKDNQDFGAFNYILDGPSMCPIEMMAPMATELATGKSWYVSGEVGDPITKTSTWLSEDEL
jgi:hypothetical protein